MELDSMKLENQIQKYMLLPLKKLMKIADKEFQLLRRMEVSDENGYVQCFCCPNSKAKYKHYKLVDSGHFIPRGHYGTRYDPRNVHPQSKHCNLYLAGNHAAFRDEMVKTFGKRTVEEMEAIKDKTPQPWREFVIGVILDSRAKIKELKKKGL
jgi:hypothetical protein